jgi:hypothetical protein
MNHDRECSVELGDAQRRNQRPAVAGKFTGKSLGKWTGLQRHHRRRFDHGAYPVGNGRRKRGRQHGCNSHRIPWLEHQPHDMGGAESAARRLLALWRVVTDHFALAP